MRVCWPVLVFGIVGTLVGAEPSKTPSKEAPKDFTGKVVPLASLLAQQDIKADADAGMALVAADGKVYTLVKDKTTRFLFVDKRLHERTVQLSARLVPGTQSLHVVQVFTVKDGKLHDVYYWCDNCALRASEPGACICCGGQTELVEVPVKKK